jgi:hypothetical protein
MATYVSREKWGGGGLLVYVIKLSVRNAVISTLLTVRGMYSIKLKQTAMLIPVIFINTCSV